MPPRGKGKSKVFSHTSTKALVSKSNDPPIPFKRASSTLEPFLSKLSKNHVYITHLDTHPANFKRKIFAVPFLMNVAIVVLLIWRIKLIGPYYAKIIQSISGYSNNEINIDTKTTPAPDLLKETLRRTSIFLFDLVLYIFIWPWPRSFFFGLPSNPIGWRLAVGFRDTEITVRRSRKWDQEIGDVVKAGAEGEEGGRLFLDNVRRAVTPTWLLKTGYLMMNREWDLDWKAMIQAHKFVNKRTIAQDDFQTSIFVHSLEFGWVSFDAFPKSTAREDSELSTREEEGRKKIMAFRDELMAIGKENLFFRWIELIQFEATQPGGFGPERQAVAVEKAKEMFEAQGVDFEKFWGKIGGFRHMPGFDEES